VKSDRTILPLALVLAFAGVGAHSQPVIPDAATLDRQQRDASRAEEDRERRLNPSGPSLKAPPAPSVTPAGPGPAFVLNGIEFSPSTFFTPADLDAFVKPLLNERIDFAMLQGMVDRINAAYRDKGQYLARAIVPPQTVLDGRIKISLVEGRAGKTSIAGVNRMSPDWVERWIAPKNGEVVDVPALDMRISRFMRATETDATLDLTEGEAQGFTNLVVNVKEPAALGLRAFVSNEGNDLTGREQAGADLRWFSPLGRGDRASANALYSRGAKSISGGYNLPFNTIGGVVSATLSKGESNIIKGPFAALGVQGKSSASGLTVRHPVGTIGRWQFDGAAGVNRYKSENIVGGFSTGEVNTHTSQGALSVGWRDSDTEFGATWQRLSGRAVAASGLALSGRADTLDMFLVERFKTNALSVQLRAQRSVTGTLPSIMQLSVGGPGSVRGYASGIFIGDGGYTLAVDYHFRVSDSVRGYAFADTGLGRLTSGASQRISSAGVGSEWQMAIATTLAAVLSQALNPAVVTTGRTRLALKLTQQF
jgi:hemolysin activation/secretion protein